MREKEQEELQAEELVEACMEELDTLYRERLQGRDVRQLQVNLHLVPPGDRVPSPTSGLAFPPMAHCPCALQDEIDEIGFRGDQEEEEDVFAVADEMRRKKREENAEADAVDDDEVRGGGY